MGEQLLKIEYHRNDDKIREAIIKETQLIDIRNLSAIRIVSVDIAPIDSKRTYILE